MFQSAFDRGRQFTRPFVTAIRRSNGEVAMGLGAWVIVNDNWGVTAAHTTQLVQEMYDAKGDSRIPNATVWLGANQMRLGQTYYLDRAADIAVFEIENLPERWTDRARFRTGPMKPGASILRMGFPFHNLEVAFDDESGEFKFNTGTPAMFPPKELRLGSSYSMSNQHRRPIQCTS